MWLLLLVTNVPLHPAVMWSERSMEVWVMDQVLQKLLCSQTADL